MAQILVVYHSQTGNTRRMAEAVAEGIRSMDGAEAVVRPAPEATLEDLLRADGVLFGTPENFGTMAGLVKDFFDRTFYPAQNQVFRKPYAVFVSAGNDGTGAVQAVERIAAGYKLKKVHPPLIVTGPPGEESLARCRELGATLAAGCQLGIY